MFCSNCGHKLNDLNVAFCPNCGLKRNVESRLLARGVKTSHRRSNLSQYTRKKRNRRFGITIGITIIILITISILLLTQLFNGQQNGEDFVADNAESDMTTESALEPMLAPEFATELELEPMPPIMFSPQNSISAGYNHTVGLREDGTVVAVGRNDIWYSQSDGDDYFFAPLDVGEWRDIVAISAGYGLTLGLKTDGTIVATGYWADLVDNFTDIVAISACVFPIGVRADGTVVVPYYLREYSNLAFYLQAFNNWTGIISVSAFEIDTIIGLKSDGTVVDTGGWVGQVVSNWTDIIAIELGEESVVWLRSDGTVVAAMYDWREIDLSHWTDIIAVSTGGRRIAGLRANGTVVAVYQADGNLTETLYDWTDIIAVSVGGGDLHTVGLRADGTVVADGSNYNSSWDGEYIYIGLLNVDEWTDIKR